jgi:hypothetical protein
MSLLASAMTFPCNADKSPIPRRGFKDAIRGVEWRKAPLVGFPTGAVNGIDVLDIDGDAGREWYDANFDAIPATRAHSTRRGMHLLFVRAPGLRCTEGKIAKGVDVRAEGGYVIWWPREGYAVEDWPICEWPDWLLAEARAVPRRGPPRVPNTCHGASEVANLTEALWQMDPVDWSEDFKNWFALVGACKAVGIGRDEFIAWSTGDERYANDGPEIERIWDSALEAHGGALHKALAERDIIEAKPKKKKSEGSSSRPTPTINLRRRTDGLAAWLAAAPTDDRLFTVAATFGEIILEKRIQRRAANQLLESACQANGLWKLLGPDRCRRTITNAFRHVEEKFLGERNDQPS